MKKHSDRAALKQRLLTGAGILALAAAIWLPGLLQPTALNGDLHLPAPGCDITASDCRARQQDYAIGLRLDADEARAATPLTFEVTLHNIPAEQVMIDLKGRDMYMGINQFPLEPVPGKPGVWRGTTELAVCVTGQMTWQAQVIAATDKARITTDFSFEAK